MIDYDKDSEEEFLEENAEDIKSDENSDEEEKELIEDDEEENKWIVPDGHLSQDEVSELQDLDPKPEVKAKNIIEILEIRRNFNKPILLDFRNPTNDFNINKIKKLTEALKAKIFNINSLTIKTYQTDVDQNSNLSGGNNNNNDFPIKLSENIGEIKKNLTGLKDNIHDRLADVIREIHGSLLSKDDLIRNIKDKYNHISKSSLAQFLKDYSERVIVKKFNRKMWYLKENIFREANINEEEAKEIFESNKKTFEKTYEEKKIQGDKLKVYFIFIF